MTTLVRLSMAAAAASVCLSVATTADAQSTRLTVLHVNDIYEISPVDGIGGFAELMTLLERERQTGTETVTTVGGDFLSPSLLSSLTQGAHMVDLFNQIGVDYAVFGNHEFDFGPEVAAARVAESSFPWLGTNVLNADGSPFGGAVSTATREVGDYTIGFLGVLTEETVTLSSPGDGVTFTPVQEAAAGAVADLEAEGADVIIALTHLTFAQDRELARAVSGIDLILGGHDHDPITFEESGTLIHKSGSDGHYLGVIHLDISTSEGRSGPEVDVLPSWAMVTTAGVEPHAEIAAVVKQYNDELDSALNIVIGRTAVELDSQRSSVRSRETAIGNLITDALVDALDADLAITNGGGIRGDKVYAAGTELTRRDILTELPFGNVGVLIELKGSDLLAALENGVSQIEDGGGRFPQVSGVSFTFDPAQPVGSRIVEAKVGDAPVDPAATYRVATNDYMFGGGDGYAALAAGTPIIDASGAKLMASTVMGYIEAKGTIEPKIEGRISQSE